MVFLNANYNSPSFQKRLVATSALPKGIDDEEIKIYHLDESDDYKELSRAQRNIIWKDNKYLDSIKNEWSITHGRYDVYTMESSNKDIICFSVVDNQRKKETQLKFIETAPQYSYKNKKNRPFKYIGETMIAFLIRKSHKKNFEVSEVRDYDATKKFYFDICEMEKSGKKGAILKKENIDSFIKKNKKHTGSEIKVF